MNLFPSDSGDRIFFLGAKVGLKELSSFDRQREGSLCASVRSLWWQ